MSKLAYKPDVGADFTFGGSGTNSTELVEANMRDFKLGKPYRREGVTSTAFYFDAFRNMSYIDVVGLFGVVSSLGINSSHGINVKLDIGSSQGGTDIQAGSYEAILAADEDNHMPGSIIWDVEGLTTGSKWLRWSFQKVGVSSMDLDIGFVWLSQWADVRINPYALTMYIQDESKVHVSRGGQVFADERLRRKVMDLSMRNLEDADLFGDGSTYGNWFDIVTKAGTFQPLMVSLEDSPTDTERQLNILYGRFDAPPRLP